MRFLISLILVSAFVSSAFAAQPVDYFKKAVNAIDPEATDVKIVTTYNPFDYASRVTQYLDRLAQQTGIDGKGIAWAFYRVQYTQKDGAIQDCTGGIGYERDLNSAQRRVDIEACNESFFRATTRFYQVVDITK